MLISVTELDRYWRIKPNGVLHVGAHLGEESKAYDTHGWQPVIWIEAQPSLVKSLQLSLDLSKNTVIEAAIWHESDKKLRLHVASNSMSSSLLELGSHAKSYPDIIYLEDIEVSTKRLDSIIKKEEMPNFINIDIQGAELPAIKSLGALIDNVDFIFVEVNRKQVYRDCTTVKELDEYLNQINFQRATTRWYFRQGWGDALYIRRTKKQAQSPSRYVFYRARTWFFYLRQILRLFQVHKLVKLLSLPIKLKNNSFE